MVKACCIKNCTNIWTKNEDITYHNFPTDSEQFAKFVSAIPQHLRRKITKYSYICSKHFTADSFLPMSIKRCRRRLKKTAVPTLFDDDYNSVMIEEPEESQCVDTCMTLSEESGSNSNSLQIKILEEKRDVSKRNTQDIGVQTSETHMELYEDVQQLRTKVKVLQERLRRRDTRIRSMMDLINVLKKSGNCTEAVEDILNSRFSGFSFDMVANELKNSSTTGCGMRYNENIKSFALTLYFYSSKAYEFVRSKLHLPHSATLRKWLSTYDCQPGFISEVFAYLEQEVKANVHLKDVSLVFDSMAIHSQVVYDKKHDIHRGYIDYGGIAHADPEELAREALVFQIVSYTQKFKIPIAFFFVNKLIADIQTEMIKHALITLHNIGIVVRSITCDGSATNFKSLSQLGCQFSSTNMVTSFKHPTADTEVHCILDACHMLKLCRNAFAEATITSPTGEISFSFVKKLHELQETEDLKLVNRLSSTHINFYNKKMNVRLAAQVVSSSVADALDFLRVSGDLRFQNCEATVEFLRIFDQLFDCMNSRSSFARGFKCPISLHNFEAKKEFFLTAEEYIKSLKIDGTNIMYHRKKVFAVGFITNIHSFIELANTLLTKLERPLKFFLTYKCSQDHIELFFSCVRSRGGFNNNLNCLEFIWTLRKMLFRNSVTPSINSNCIDDCSQSVAVLQFRSSKRSVVENLQETNESDENLQKLIACIDSMALSGFQKNILYYISGVVVEKILVKLSCTYCTQFLIDNGAHDHTYTSNINKYRSFTAFVNRGKLCFPSNAVFQIIEDTEKVFKAQVHLGYMHKEHFKRNLSSLIVQKYMDTIISLFKPPHPVCESDGLHELHEIQILKAIVNIYANIRIFTHSKKITERHLGNCATLRHKLNKIILFSNV